MNKSEWQKVYTPDETMLDLRVKNTLSALREERTEPERRTSMKRVLILAMVCVMVMAGTVGASSLFAKEYDPVRRAGKALAEEYGVTEEMQTYFKRVVHEEDGVTTIVYNGMEGMDHVLGDYIVTIEDGRIAVEWTKDGESTEGGLDAKAWGAEQLKILIEMTQEDQGFSRGYRKAQSLLPQEGDVIVSITSAEGETITLSPDTAKAEQPVRLDPSDPSVAVSEEKAMEIALAGIAQEYGLTQAQLQQMEYNREYAGYTFAVADGRAICELWFWLHQDEAAYHTEGDGIYRAVIDAKTGEIIDLLYDSALAGNG